eukprot:3060024-Amphidinium_carterae.2
MDARLQTICNCCVTATFCERTGKGEAMLGLDNHLQNIKSKYNAERRYGINARIEITSKRQSDSM